MRNGRAVAAQYAKAVAVEMHRMPPGGLVAHGEDAAPSTLKRQKRRHAGGAVARHGHAIDGPGCLAIHAGGRHAAHATHAAHHAAAHHAALKRQLMALGGGEVSIFDAQPPR